MKETTVVKSKGVCVCVCGECECVCVCGESVCVYVYHDYKFLLLVYRQSRGHPQTTIW